MAARRAKLAQLVEQRIRNAQVVSSSLTFGSMKKGLRSALVPFFRGVAQFGSAFGSGPKGRGFKSRRPDQEYGPSLADGPYSYFVEATGFEAAFRKSRSAAFLAAWAANPVAPFPTQPPFFTAFPQPSFAAPLFLHSYHLIYLSCFPSSDKNGPPFRMAPWDRTYSKKSFSFLLLEG